MMRAYTKVTLSSCGERIQICISLIVSEMNETLYHYYTPHNGSGKRI